MAVEFKDYSMKVKGVLDDATKAWITTWSNEIASQAKDNVQMDGEAGNQLRGSYRATRKSQNQAYIGTPLESGYWEEFGTGDHAVRSPHRSGWWVYSNDYEGDGGKVLTEAQAKAIAAASGGKLHATNGRDPSYTLQNAFMVSAPKAEADLERIMKERFGK